MEIPDIEGRIVLKRGKIFTFYGETPRHSELLAKAYTDHLESKYEEGRESIFRDIANFFTTHGKRN